MFIWKFQKSPPNHRTSFSCRLLFIALLGILIFSTTASARIPGLPRLDEDALTVMNIPIVVKKENGEDDKKANSIAILKAHREAFRRLAKKSMTPEAFKAYKIPDDGTLMGLMRSFEVSNMRSSPEQYEAIFCVRFNTDILRYLNIRGGAGKSFPTR